MTEAVQTEWLNAIPTAIFVVQDERIAFSNRAAGDLIGCAPAELNGTPFASLMQDAGTLSGEHNRARLKLRSGTALSVELTNAEIEYGGKPARMITALKRDRLALYRDAIAGSIDSFYLTRLERDADGKASAVVVVDASERGIEQASVPRDQVIGLSLTDLYPEASYSDLIEGFAHALETGEAYSRELFLSNRVVIDGWYHVQLVPLENDHVAVFLRDIGERKESEEVVNRLVAEVEQQARLLDEVLSATPDAFILFDRAGHYLYVNRKGLENSGLTSEQVIGKTWRELGFPEESGLIFEKRLEQVFTTGESITYEEQFPTLLGLRDFVTTLTAIHDPDGKVIFMLNTIHDITERKQAEVDQQKLAAELEQQARVFDEVLSTTPDSFLMIDRDSRFLYSSPAALSNASLTAKQVVGKTWSELGFPEEVGQRSDQSAAQVFATGQPVTFEQVFPTAQGLRDFESIFSPVHDKDGQVVAVVITNRDITERKQMEEALRENQRLLTSINETALAGIAVVDVNGIYVQVNRAYASIYGYSAAEMIGQHSSMILPPELRQEAAKAHQRVMSGEASGTIRHWQVMRKDGGQTEVVSYNNLLVRENGDRFRVVVVLDVSEQRAAQRALEASEQRLTSILSSMEDAVWSVDMKTYKLLYSNPALEWMTGYSASEFQAEPGLMSAVVHSDDRARFVEELMRVLEGQNSDIEYRIVRRDEVIRWVHCRFWMVSGTTGKRIDGIMTDITDRRQAAEHTLQVTIERERVRILSDFVRDASHEFRTPLSVINTRLYLMEKISDPLRQLEYIEGIKEQAARILQLVESLITMSRLDSLHTMRLEPLDLNRVLVLMNVRAQANATRGELTFTLDLSPETLNIQGETNELMTAFEAIFDNAFHYTPRHGQIEVHSSRLNAQEIVVDVRDSGVGISADELPRIFERFYRVDRARSIHGFGLGLPIARKIVEMHGGRIEVESTPGQGSLFRLIFPADHSQVE